MLMKIAPGDDREAGPASDGSSGQGRALGRAARLVDGSGLGGEVAVVSLSLPQKSGLLVRRRRQERRVSRRAGRLPVAAGGRRAVLAARSASVVGEEDGLEFFSVGPAEVTRVGVSMGRMSHLESVTLFPLWVSPGRTALAVALADLLRAERGDGLPVVTCGGRPAVGVGRSAVPHLVKVTEGSAWRVVPVWEVVAWEDVAAWLAVVAGRGVVA
ncbi:hypothetical protein [Pseudofrankia asymbiotica]|uniref:Uncharacterized protein n=1 Tax=Pseudofrankia asymbiotica TaxID=1834516 RepID=A0A1V2I9B5_9ACTN|nr:hypothetical protein [Pseudofrankia asymbiotica]ONH29125.1 hypothetical protein BL253_17045 [Pseudofrankia asymbiotica]